MGYLKRCGESRYRIIYDLASENGKRRQKRETLEAVTKKEAEAILARREAEVLAKRKALENGDTPKDEIELALLFEQFLSEKRRQKEENTIRRYQTLVKLYLKPRFGAMQAKNLKPHHLMTAYGDWLEHGREGRANVSAKTIRHAHELLRNVLHWGKRRELLSRNVAALVADDDLPKVIQPKPVALTEKELKRVLEEAKNPSSRSKKRDYLSAEPWFYPAVAFAAYTGARRGEIVAVRRGETDLEATQVTIARSLTESMTFKPPKNDKTRTLTMPKTLCVILKTHLAQQAQERLFLGAAYKDNDLLFARPDGSPIDPWNFARAVRDLILRAKVTPITLHGLRYTHASLLAKAGVPIEVVSQRLGHASIGVTVSRYLHVYMSRDADAADAFGRLVG
jgi:integrase